MYRLRQAVFSLLNLNSTVLVLPQSRENLRMSLSYLTKTSILFLGPQHLIYVPVR